VLGDAARLLQFHIVPHHQMKVYEPMSAGLPRS
jgi:hypothetical protein